MSHARPNFDDAWEHFTSCCDAMDGEENGDDRREDNRASIPLNDGVAQKFLQKLRYSLSRENYRTTPRTVLSICILHKLIVQLQEDFLSGILHISYA